MQEEGWEQLASDWNFPSGPREVSKHPLISQIIQVSNSISATFLNHLILLYCCFSTGIISQTAKILGGIRRSSKLNSSQKFASTVFFYKRKKSWKVSKICGGPCMLGILHLCSAQKIFLIISYIYYFFPKTLSRGVCLSITYRVVLIRAGQSCVYSRVNALSFDSCNSWERCEDKHSFLKRVDFVMS